MDAKATQSHWGNLNGSIGDFLNLFFVHLFVLATPYSMQDLCSLTRD